jgi:hypothetical protein
MTKKRLLSRVANTDKMGIKNPATSIIGQKPEKEGRKKHVDRVA